MSAPEVRAALAVAAGLLAAGSALAAPAGGAEPALIAFGPIARGAGLVAALGLLALAARLLVRRNKRSRGASNARIDVLCARSLGPRQRAVLLEVDGRRLLIGIGADGMRTLADLGEDAGFREALASRLPQALDPGDFGLGRFEGLDG